MSQPITLNDINAAIDKKYPGVRLGEGVNYYYIYSDNSGWAELISQLHTTCIYCKLEFMTLEQWLETVGRMLDADI